MFEHETRKNLLDLLRPPSGYRLEAAVGTTYSLDFVSLTAALLAFVDGEAGDSGEELAGPDVLHAITRMARRVLIFANRTHISGAGRPNKLTPLFDHVVRDVNMGGPAFHPKVWVLHYRPKQTAAMVGRPAIIRVICSSRNLSSAQFWEAFVCAEGLVQARPVRSGFNRGVCSFLEHLAMTRPGDSGQLLAIEGAVHHTEFELPAVMKGGADFLWQGAGGDGGLRKHVPSSGDHALLVSPFTRKTFLEVLLGRFQQVTVISRQSELDAIEDELFMARLRAGGNRVFVVNPATTPEGSEALELHAKMLFTEGPSGTQLFIGSANASPAGWFGGNCEAVVRMSPGISIAHFCERYLYEQDTRPAQRIWRGWISEYTRQPHQESDEDRLEREMDQVCQDVGGVALIASYDRDQRSLLLKCKDGQCADDWLARLAAYDIRAGLLTLVDAPHGFPSWRDLLTSGATVPEVAIADLTEFVLVKIVHTATRTKRSFIVVTESNFASLREGRDACVLQQLLTKRAVEDFLRAILFDKAVQPWTGKTAVGGTGSTGDAGSQALRDVAFEDVLRACTEDASRIDEVNQLIKTFAGTDMFDPLFLKFWTNFISAHSDVTQENRRG